MDLIEGMKVFTAVVEAGSFVAAADKLEMSRGMATRYVAQLETHLGVRLLHRSTRKLSLTEAGQDYHQRALLVLAMVEEAGSSVAQEAAKPRGVLRITTSVAFGVHHLGWLITDYLAKYPEVQIDVSLNDRSVDLIEEGFDLAVRVATRIDPSLIARKITHARVLPCASPAYLKKHGSPKTPADLASHNCLSYACLLYTSPSPRDRTRSRMPSSA